MGARGPSRGTPATTANKKALSDKIQEGTAGNARVISIKPDNIKALKPTDIPAPALSAPDFLAELSKNTQTPTGDEIHERTVKWLENAGCLHLILPDMISAYAMWMARWLQCEEANSRIGLLTKHPITNVADRSPYFKMAIEASREAQAIWKQIYQIVYDNSQVNFKDFKNPNEDNMFKLLRSRAT